MSIHVLNMIILYINNCVCICIKSVCCFTTQALCIGVLASAIATVSTVNNAEIFDDDEEGFRSTAASMFDNREEDGDRFREVAWWLLCLGITGIVSQSIMFFIRILYYAGRIETLFIVFGILVRFVCICDQICKKGSYTMHPIL